MCINIVVSVSVPSKKVIWRAASDVRFATSWCGIEDQEIVIHLLINFHYSSLITTSVAIIGR